jgi:Phosphatidate phosphatase APP1, catalytic domain
MRLRRTRRPDAPAPEPALLCRWDLDKTYLRSEFDTLRSLLRTAFEKAEDKVDVPGVAELIRSLKSAAERRGRPVSVQFISASPPQIGSAIRKKLALDRVPYDGIVFKDQLSNLKRGKLRNLREHVGFKLAELLRGRLDAPGDARELLFGDDWESDSLIYSLYADVIAGRLGVDRLTPVLQRIRVDPRLVETIVALAGRAVVGDFVVRIFINLERRSPPGVFRLFGPRVVPTFNYFQTAAVLAADGYLDPEDAARVGRALLDAAGYTPRRLVNSLDDLVRRAHLTPAAAKALATPLRAAGVLPATAVHASRWQSALGALRRLRRRARATPEPGTSVAPLDYDAILDRLAARDTATAV